MEHQRLSVVAPLMAIGSGVVWSFGAILKRLSEDVGAFQYLIWRSVGIIVVIEILSALKRQPFPTIRAWRSGRWMALANLGLFLASIAFVYAVDTTTAANAAFLGSLTPLVAVVFTRFLGERLSTSTIVAIAVGIVGLLLTVFGDIDAGNMLGNASALLASVGFAIYTISVRSDPTRDWSPVLSGYGLLMIVVCSIVTVARDRPLVPAGDDIFRGAARLGVHRGRHPDVQRRAETCAGRADDRVRSGGDGVRSHLGVLHPPRDAGSIGRAGRGDHLRGSHRQGRLRHPRRAASGVDHCSRCAADVTATAPIDELRGACTAARRRCRTCNPVLMVTWVMVTC